MENTTKINYSLKKLVGKQHTWNSKQWFEEADGITLHQHATEVWIDTIPAQPPIDTNPIVEQMTLTLVEDNTVQGRRSFYAVDENNEILRGFIPPSYGVNYSVIIKAGTAKIPTSHPSQPLFDYANGVLSFENTPPAGDITVTVYRYTGRTFAQYLDSEDNSVSRGILGFDNPTTEYIIQHNMSSFEVDVTLYTYDDVDGTKYWKKDVVPMILLDENRVKVQLTEPQPIRFIVKSYAIPTI